jgi:polyketide biosynthesis acyl carrier protein
MTRDEIFAVVRAQMISIIDELDETTVIDEHNRMADLGADSIDVVEIVSGSIRALGVKVDRTKLDRVQSIAGLVDLLEEAVAQKQVHNSAVQ